MTAPAPPPETPSPEAAHQTRGFERALEATLFHSRWLLAPIYLGLIGGLAILTIKFLQELVAFVPRALSATQNEVILTLLSLIDLALVSNLVLMVMLSGYENFVSKIDVRHHPDRPDWMGKLDFGGLKLKLISSIVAISSILLLKVFMNIDKSTDRDLAWMIGIHALFIVSGLILAWTEKLSARK